ncbi:hypothetical protein B0T16DRAFT_506291, partial [Cercophora newfieldiana]
MLCARWMVRQTGRLSDRQIPVVAPSWSWMSVLEPIHYEFLRPFTQYQDQSFRHFQPCAKLLEISAVRVDPTSFRHFKGELVLQAPLVVVTIGKAHDSGCVIPLDNRPSTWWPGMQDGHNSGSLFGKPFSSPADRRVHSDPVLESGYTKVEAAQYALILRRQGGNMFTLLGLLVVAQNFGKLCTNDPRVCQNEGCRVVSGEQETVPSTGRKCLGLMQTVHLI